MFRSGADPRGVLRAVVEDIGDDVRWARGVLEAADGLIDGHHGMALQWMEHDALVVTRETQVVGTGFSPAVRLTVDDARTFGPGAMSAVFQTQRPYVSVATALAQVNDGAARETFERYGVGDLAGVLTAPSPHLFVSFAWILDRVRPPSAQELRVLGKLSLHLEAGMRLREAPHLDGVVSPDAVALEGALPPARLWRALSAGRSTLVPGGRGEGRHLKVLKNPPHLRARRQLTPEEVAVVELSARGLSGKQQAWQLGCATTTVSRRLTSATAKLGLSSQLETIRFAAGVFGAVRARGVAELTAAEREVLRLVRAGLSNAEIARERGTSERTIANQVASLLRKTGETGRRGLISLMA